jgi:hypothetical protein
MDFSHDTGGLPAEVGRQEYSKANRSAVQLLPFAIDRQRRLNDAAATTAGVAQLVFIP